MPVSGLFLSTVESRYLEVVGTFFKSSNNLKCKLICTLGNSDLLKESPQSWFNSRKHFWLKIQLKQDFACIQHIWVRDIEIWLYVLLFFCSLRAVPRHTRDWRTWRPTWGLTQGRSPICVSSQDAPRPSVMPATGPSTRIGHTQTRYDIYKEPSTQIYSFWLWKEDYL